MVAARVERDGAVRADGEDRCPMAYDMHMPGGRHHALASVTATAGVERGAVHVGTALVLVGMEVVDELGVGIGTVHDGSLVVGGWWLVV